MNILGRRTNPTKFLPTSYENVVTTPLHVHWYSRRNESSLTCENLQMAFGFQMWGDNTDSGHSKNNPQMVNPSLFVWPKAGHHFGSIDLPHNPKAPAHFFSSPPQGASTLNVSKHGSFVCHDSTIILSHLMPATF